MSTIKNNTPELNGNPKLFTKIISNQAPTAGVIGIIPHCNNAIEPNPITAAFSTFTTDVPYLFTK